MPATASPQKSLLQFLRESPRLCCRSVPHFRPAARRRSPRPRSSPRSRWTTLPTLSKSRKSSLQPTRCYCVSRPRVSCSQAIPTDSASGRVAGTSSTKPTRLKTGACTGGRLHPLARPAVGHPSRSRREGVLRPYPRRGEPHHRDVSRVGAGTMVAASDDPLPPYPVFDPSIWKQGCMYHALTAGVQTIPGRKRIQADFLHRSQDLEKWESWRSAICCRPRTEPPSQPAALSSPGTVRSGTRAHAGRDGEHSPRSDWRISAAVRSASGTPGISDLRLSWNFGASRYGPGGTRQLLVPLACVDQNPQIFQVHRNGFA